MYWLLGRHSTLSTYNKILLYQRVFKPVWTYGIQLWGNRMIFQRFQNKVLRGIVNAPWYILNDDLHKDLEVEIVDVIKKYARSHQQHVNSEVLQLLDNAAIERKLKRTKPFKLVQ